VTEVLLLGRRSVRQVLRLPEATIPTLFIPLLFLTPNFVPFDRLTPLMEALARANPVSYVIEGLRSLVIQGWDADKLAACALVIVVMGTVLTGLSLRAIATYDR